MVKKAKAPKRAKSSKAAPAKKATKVAKVAKKAAPKVALSAPVKVVKDAYSKSQLIGYITERTALSRKQVSSVLEAQQEAIYASLSPRSVGVITLPGVAKFVRIRKPAKKARQGINPFTGEPTTFKAKPAKNVVKARILKKVKYLLN
jgi:nucleoid DNA-binding protein